MEKKEEENIKLTDARSICSINRITSRASNNSNRLQSNSTERYTRRLARQKRKRETIASCDMCTRKSMKMRMEYDESRTISRSCKVVCTNASICLLSIGDALLHRRYTSIWSGNVPEHNFQHSCGLFVSLTIVTNTHKKKVFGSKSYTASSERKRLKTESYVRVCVDACTR